MYTAPERPVITGPETSPAPGTPIRLDCTAQNADELATLVWIKGGETIDRLVM